MPFYVENFNEFFAQALSDNHVGLTIGLFYDEVVTRLVSDQLSINDIEVMLMEAESQVNKEQDVLRFSNLVTMRGAFYQAKSDFVKSFTEMKEEDYRLAIECYEKAMDLGNVAAISYRAYLLSKEGLDFINDLAAIHLYEKAIALGNVSAMSDRAFMYTNGCGCTIDYAAAIRLYEQAIKLGLTVAMVNRACMHQKGQGGPINYPAAIELLLQAKARGNANAICHLAEMYENGTGVTQNYQLAMELYDAAIERGNAAAMSNRALMHERGVGGPVNYPAAIALYEKAIRLGNATAMNNRGLMHKNGFGGPVNYPIAILLYKKAIKRGILSAMHNLACIYEQNQMGETNYPAAIALYDEAVALGHKHATYNRALMHFWGRGGNVNYVASLSLMRQLGKLIKEELNTYRITELQNDILTFKSKIALIENKDIGTQYQWLMLQYEDSEISFKNLFIFFRSHPAAFIKFIATDAVLRAAEKNTHVSLLIDFCAKTQMSITRVIEKDTDAVNKKVAFETIANYFIAQVDKAMVEIPVNLNKVLIYLAEIPSVSSVYRSALLQEADLLNSLVRERQLFAKEKFEIFARIEDCHQEILQIDASLLRDKAQGLEREILELEKNPGSNLKRQALKSQNIQTLKQVNMIESVLQGNEDARLLKSLNWQEMENKNILLYLQRKIDYAGMRQTLKEECIEKLNQQLLHAEREKNNFTSQYKLFSNKLSVIVKAQAIQKLLNLLQGNNSQEAFLPQELTTLKTYTLSKIMAEYKVLFPEGLHAESKTLSKKITNF